MDKKFSKGGLIKKGEDSNISFEILLPGETYVPKAIAEKYGSKFFRKLLGVEKIILIEDEKSS